MGSADKLRILHVCPRTSFSGLEAYALAMATGQRDLGHDVSFVVLAGSPLADKCRHAKIPTIDLRSGFSGRLEFLQTIGTRLRAPDSPHVVHLHSTQDVDLMLMPLLATRFRGTKTRPRVILQTHIWISHSKRDPIHAATYRLIDEIWCSSRPARESLQKLLPVASERIRVVNYGREVEKTLAGFLPRDRARHALGLPKEAIVVGSVARIDRGKGTLELLEAMLRLMPDNPDLHLIWIGPPTADDPKAIAFSQEIASRVANLPPGLKTRVHMPGAIPDSYRLLKAFDLFALPTYKECFSLSLLEALLAGLPCLATDSGGSPEVVRENETGWLFAPESVESLVAAFGRALEDREQWLQFGENGTQRVRRDFDFARILPLTIETYRQIVGLAPPPPPEAHSASI